MHTCVYIRDVVLFKDFFITCNALPFSCTHLPLLRGKGKVKDPSPRYEQHKNDPRISLQQTVFIKLFQKKVKITILFLLKNPKSNNIILVISTYLVLVFGLSKGLDNANQSATLATAER